MSLWAHYDVMDNMLIHVTGRKRVKLWSPSLYSRLHVRGSSCEPIPAPLPTDLQSNWSCYASFQGTKPSLEVILEPGDILFIPALWFHHVETLSDDGPAMSLNIFYRPLLNQVTSSNDSQWWNKKDLYGNRDPKPVEEFEKVCDQFMQLMDTHFSKDFKTFYGQKFMSKWLEYLNRD